MKVCAGILGRNLADSIGDMEVQRIWTGSRDLDVLRLVAHALNRACHIERYPSLVSAHEYQYAKVINVLNRQ